MIFTNFWFFPTTICLLVVLVLVQLMFRKSDTLVNNISKVIILLYSLYIIATFDIRFILCVLWVWTITYFGAIFIEKSRDTRKKIYTRCTVLCLLITFGVFKYINFLLGGIIAPLTGKTFPSINIILPIGISFYILSSISYVLDVSWNKIAPDKNPINILLFICFFPKLVCGPILKGRDFIPQLQENRRITIQGFTVGIQIFVFGFFKKIVLADRLAVFVDAVFDDVTIYGAATVWLAVFSYIIQLYLDFSGYSDMAIGVFKILGYDVGRNFNLPFISTTISDFWLRWHMSLGSFLTEYVFNPIAITFKRKVASWSKENRKRFKMLPTYTAVFITFIVSGIWHGAGWTFIVFGLLHGTFSVIQQIYGNYIKKHELVVGKKRRIRYALDILLNFILITMIQIIFRAGTIIEAKVIFGQLFNFGRGVEQPYSYSFVAYVLLIISTVMAYRNSNNKSLKWDERVLKETNGYYIIQDLTTIKGLTLFFVLCGICVMLGYYGDTYFIYGQF